MNKMVEGVVLSALESLGYSKEKIFGIVEEALSFLLNSFKPNPEKKETKSAYLISKTDKGLTVEFVTLKEIVIEEDGKQEEYEVINAYKKIGGKYEYTLTDLLKLINEDGSK